MASGNKSGHTITATELWDISTVNQPGDTITTPEAISETLNDVICALEERGYDPTDQLAGYFLTGEPTYITSHRDARTKISTIRREALLAGIIKCYILYAKESKSE